MTRYHADHLTSNYSTNPVYLCKDVDPLISALKKIADMPDCLYKGDAKKMRTIARKAVKATV